ncbi:MAG TPA: hypothetical protein VFW19_09720 [Allosphingosinicella sp.]|nr:hypothetical protein [Allosphingosinicella sp.]
MQPAERRMIPDMVEAADLAYADRAFQPGFLTGLARRRLGEGAAPFGTIRRLDRRPATGSISPRPSSPPAAMAGRRPGAAGPSPGAAG